MPNKPTTFKDIARMCGAMLHGPGGKDAFQGVFFDSRQTPEPAGQLFVALKGPFRDGHDFIPDLIRQGFRYFLTQTKPENPAPEATYLVVDQPLEALQHWAAAYRKEFSGEVVAIAGSNGKTVVKEWLFQLTQPRLAAQRSPRSFNSQLGVALSILQLQKNNKVALIETGISEPGEMVRLHAMVQPTGGIFTTLGSAHEAQFTNPAEKLREKALIFKGCKWVVFRNDRTWSDQLDDLLDDGTKRITWRVGKGEATLVLDPPTLSGKIQRVKGTLKGKPVQLTIPFTDAPAFENAINAWLGAIALGLKPEDLALSLSKLEPVSMRMEMVEGRHNCLLINDSYNSDLESLRAALSHLSQQVRYTRRVVILSDLLQTGQDEVALYKNVASMIQSAGATEIMAVGPALARHKPWMPPGTQFFLRTEDLMQELRRNPPSNAAVLIKGARLFGFEVLLDHLRKKAHQTALEIDLSALEHNLKSYRSTLKPGVKLMAMTKAFSYGVGAFEVAQLLEQQGVDYLAVAYSDEGVQLREQGITLPIMVMNPDPEAVLPLIQHRLEPEVFNLAGLEMMGKRVLEGQVSPTGYPIHLKLETGMNRLGFDEATLEQALDQLDDMPWLEVRSVFSHLVASEDPAQNAFTKQQIERFKHLAGMVEAWNGKPVIKHILNTAGIQHHPEGQLDMVRLGLGLYGVDPSGQSKLNLRSVARLTTSISQLKYLQPGDTVGYGRTFVADKPMVSATLPIGYADGFDRRLSNGKGHVFIHGKAAPVLGRVCMDMIMVDVSGIDCKEGDQAEVFGRHQRIEDLALAMDTIPYEVLTGLSSRIKRVYFRD